MKILKYLILASIVTLTSCITVNLSDPQGKRYTEVILEGNGKDKVALISINGTINDQAEKGFMSSGPSMLQDFLTKLKLAEYDPAIKAVLLKINSPGGTVTASDIIYKEIKNFKERSNKLVVVSMMDVAASGGYYISLAADYIIAHPTTITGSIGVIFLRPDVKNLINKLGVDIIVSKSGKNKDMGSMFRASTDEEEKLFSDLINNHATRFLNIVKENRKITKEALNEIKTARIFLADRAKELNLIDEIAYLNEALIITKNLAKIPNNSQVVAYRNSLLYYDNIYNNMNSKANIEPLVNIGIPDDFLKLKSGLYYLWEPGTF